MHDKKDSTGICFIGERNFREFLAEYIAPDPGEIRTADEVVIGEHDGLQFFTLGQRQGLGIGGVRGYPESPWYVAGKDEQDNALLVTQTAAHLESSWLAAGDLNWLLAPDAFPKRCAAKVRYRQADEPCTLSWRADGRLLARFDRPQRAVTPGQYVCLYDGDVCLGGGVIELSG